jgi:hypothetical protein
MSTSIAPAPHRHLDADGAPLLEVAAPGTGYMLLVKRGSTAATTPAVGVEIDVSPGGVLVVHWLHGEPFARMGCAGDA